MGEMAGPILPSESNAFSVGSSNNRFLDAYFSRAVDISGVAISPDATGSGIKVTSAATGALADIQADYIQASNIRSVGDVQAAYVLGSNIRSVVDIQAVEVIADYVLGSNIRCVGDVHANYVLGSNIRSVGDVQAQNITASGLLTASNIRVLGDYVILDTITSNTEQMVITNDGTGPALKVTQTGANSIAEFYDDGNALAFKVANDGLIGIGTATPQQKLHVQGNILASGTVTGSSFSGSGSSLTTLNADNVSTGTLAVARGGTGIASYAVGDLIYASGTTAITKLADVATGNSLISGGINAVPSWGKIGLTTHVSGTLGVANGGTGAATLTANKLLVGNGTTAVLQPTNLHWDNTNSRLGIGNVSPNRPITLAADSIGISMHNSNPGTDPSITNNSIWFYDNNTYPSRITGGHWANYGSFVDIHANTSEPSMRVIAGKVGIGTTNPQQKLHVEGNMRITNGHILKPNSIYVNVYKTGYATHTAGSVITFTGLLLNVGSAWSTSLSRFTAPVHGFYAVHVNLLTSNEANDGGHEIYINGAATSPLRRGYGWNSATTAHKNSNSHWILDLSANSYFDVRGTNTISWYGTADTAHSHMSIHLLG
jgi:hypothetical protein